MGGGQRFRIKDVVAIFLFFPITLLFYWKLVFTNLIPVDYDLFTYFYPYREYASAALLQGKLPFWNPYLFMGVPFLANVQTAVLYPLNLPMIFFDAPRAVILSLIFHVFLAGIFMYLFARLSLGISSMGSFIAALVFMFSGFLTQQMGHVNQLNAAIWIPLIFLVWDRAIKRRSIMLVLAGGVVLAVQLLAGHTQESFITMVALVFYGMFRLFCDGIFALPGPIPGGRRVSVPLDSVRSIIRSQAWTGFALAAVLILGFGLAALQWLPTYELSVESIRGGGLAYDEAISFSLPPWLLLRSLLPGFGDNPFSEFVGYVGIIPLALALQALVRPQKAAYTLFWIFLAGIALFLAFGGFNPLYEWILRYLPGFSLFRVPARWLFLYTFAVALLAGMGADRALSFARINTRTAWVPWSLAWFFLVTTVLAVWGWISSSLGIGPGPMLVWASLAGLSLLLIKGGPWLLPRGLILPIVAALVLGELFLSGMGLWSDKLAPPPAYSSMMPSIAQLQSDKGLYRILSMATPEFDPGDKSEAKVTWGSRLDSQEMQNLISSNKYKEILSPNLPMEYRIASIDGYDGGVLPLRRYVEFKTLFLNDQSYGSAAGKNPNQTDALLRDQLKSIPNTQLLGMANVKYVIMDKMGDVWVDNAYYDLSARLEVKPGSPVRIASLPSLAITSLGIVSYLGRGERLADLTPVANVTVFGQQGEVVTATLRAGLDTAPGEHDTQSQGQARIVYREKNGTPLDSFFARINLGKVFYPREVRIEYLLPTGSLNLRGISLLDSRTLANEAVVIHPRLKLVHSGDVKIYENLDWLPRAFLVRDYEVVRGNGDLLASIQRDGTKKVILDKWPSWTDLPTRLPAAREQLQIISYQPEQVTLQVEAVNPVFLVLSDSYYPGWEAFIDGQKVEILKAYHLFRALYVPPGSHRVEFVYQPQSWVWGLAITGITAGLVFGSFVFWLSRWCVLRVSIRHRRTEQSGIASSTG